MQSVGGLKGLEYVVRVKIAQFDNEGWLKGPECMVVGEY